MQMEFNFNEQIDFDSIDISECKSDNNLLKEEYLMYQNISGEDETDESTNVVFDINIRNNFTNVNENATIYVAPKIFEIVKDKTRRRK